MKRNRYLPIIALCFIMFVNLACGLGSFGAKDAETDADAEALRIEAGGFSFVPIEDYQMQQFYGMITLTAADASPEVGPSIMLAGGSNQGETNESTLENFKAGVDQNEYQVDDPKKIDVEGVDGFQVDLSGTHGGVEVMGRLVIATDEVRTFTMIGIAPKERWNAEVKNLFDDVFKSLTFFVPDENGPESNLTGEGGGEFRQWAAAVVASSQYEDENFSAEQMIGAPNTPACGDFPTSWSSELDYTQEWVRLTYVTPVLPTQVNIHQTFNPSQVIEVKLIDENGNSHTVYESSPVKMDCPYILSIPVSGADYKVIAVEILLDQSVLGISWNEIDAVELVGLPEGMASQPQVVEEQPEVAEEPEAVEEPQSSQPEVSANYDYLPSEAYKGYVQVVIGQTYTADLSGLFGQEGREETGLKPRPDADKTFSFDLGDGKKAYVGVTTSGMVYKKSIPDAYYPDPAVIASQELYDQIVVKFNDTGAVPYSEIAEMLGSPGFPMEAYLTEDDTLKEQFSWMNTNGYYISAFFVDGVMTGAWALSYGNR